jgi:HK97 family phage prohead protease
VVTLRVSAPAEQAAEPTADDRTVNVVASTSSVNSYGYSVDPAGWDLTRFLANPVVLFDHGCGPDGAMPIGKAENVRVEDAVLKATIRFASAAVSPIADRCLAGFREGVLNAVSVGFQPVEIDFDDDEAMTVRRADLWEISVVAVPADPGALREQTLSTLSALRGTKARPMTKKQNLTAKLAKILNLAAEGEPVEGEEPKPAADLAVSDDAVMAAVEQMKAAFDALLAALAPPAEGEEASAPEEQAAQALKAIGAAKLAASKSASLAAENADLRKSVESHERAAIVAKLRSENRLTAHQAKFAARLSLVDLKDFAADAPVNAMLSASDVEEKTADPLSGKTFGSMTRMEKHALYNSNRALYDQLSAAHKMNSGR